MPECCTCEGQDCLACEVQIHTDHTYELRWKALLREVGRLPDPVTRIYFERMVRAIEEEIT